MKTETLQSVLELVKSQKDFLVDNPYLEMELEFKNIPAEVLKQLAKHYEPFFDSDEVINKPSEILPYFYFTKRINESLLITFRTCSLKSSITFN
jgi:hypothetical protein